jgi:Na+/melibiose symporter-like transporter
MPILMIGSAAVGALGSGLWVLAPSMIGDVAEEHELRTNERSDGAFMGLFAAGIQTAAGLGVALAGILLDQFAHVVPGSPTQSPSTIARIGILSSIVPGVITIAAGVVMLSYNLTRDRVSLVQARLTARRVPAP